MRSSHEEGLVFNRYFIPVLEFFLKINIGGYVHWCNFEKLVFLRIVFSPDVHWTVIFCWVGVECEFILLLQQLIIDILMHRFKITQQANFLLEVSPFNLLLVLLCEKSSFVCCCHDAFITNLILQNGLINLHLLLKLMRQICKFNCLNEVLPHHLFGQQTPIEVQLHHFYNRLFKSIFWMLNYRVII